MFWCGQEGGDETGRLLELPYVQRVFLSVGTQCKPVPLVDCKCDAQQQQMFSVISISPEAGFLEKELGLGWMAFRHICTHLGHKLDAQARVHGWPISEPDAVHSCMVHGSGLFW